MGEFRDWVLNHLSDYRLNHLGVSETGKWGGQSYGHILPKSQERLNILERCRDAFWGERETGRLKGIGLHGGFHHLNSSQALCFNLFYPYYAHCGRHLPLLLDALSLPTDPEAKPRFEDVPDPAEGTNFDFTITYSTGARIMFEMKYTESGFGRPDADESHRRKFDSVYLPRAQKVLKPAFHEPESFIQYYQILRNLVYLGDHPENRCIFLVPAGSDALRELDKYDILGKALLPEHRNRAVVLKLEDLVARLATTVAGSDRGTLAENLHQFVDKYCPGLQLPE